jgi:hypothetical protein
VTPPLFRPQSSICFPTKILCPFLMSPTHLILRAHITLNNTGTCVATKLHFTLPSLAADECRTRAFFSRLSTVHMKSPRDAHNKNYRPYPPWLHSLPNRRVTTCGMIGWECSTLGSDEKWAVSIWEPEGKNHMKGLGVNGIILRGILKKWGWKGRVFFIFFIASGVGLSPLHCGHFWPIVPAPDDRWGW